MNMNNKKRFCKKCGEEIPSYYKKDLCDACSRKKTNKIVRWALAIGGILGLGGGAYAFYSNQSKNSSNVDDKDKIDKDDDQL